METLASLLILIALFFMFFGVLGLFRFKDFYARILISSKIETVGFLTIMIGLMLFSGFSFASLKIFLILLLMIITNPLSTHAIARSAFINGYKPKEREKP